MTIKTIAFMPRKTGTTRTAFRTHYETRHAPLAIPLFPFVRYRRNHLREDSGEPGFDCISEFWIESLERIGQLMAGEVGATMDADERLFLDQEHTVTAISDPVVPDGDAGPTLLLLGHAGGERAALRDACRQSGASLEFLSPMSDKPLPFDTMVRPGARALAVPWGWSVGPCLEVTPMETPRNALMG